MWKTGITAAVAFFCSQTIFAENLQITAAGVDWEAGPEQSCWVTLRVDNTGTPDNLLIWQLVFQIVPIGDASGVVSIAGFSKPPAYVFGADSPAIVSSSDSPLGPAFSGMANDLTNGVDVPPSGKNLLQLQLTSQDAVGRFDIVVAPNDTGFGSNWLPPSFVPQNFDVTSFPGRPERVVESVVFSSLPEPSNSSMLLWVIVVLTLACSGRFRFSLTMRRQPRLD